MYGVSLINRYMGNPTEVHLKRIKKILCYLNETRDFDNFL